MSRSTYEPICSPEAEQAVLGAILIRPEVMATVVDILQPADFYADAHHPGR
jgi:replicative DNA helicase